MCGNCAAFVLIVAPIGEKSRLNIDTFTGKYWYFSVPFAVLEQISTIFVELNIREKTMKSLKEDLNNLKDKHNLTLQDIAEKSGIPMSTVKKIFSGQTLDPGYLSMKPILDVLQQEEKNSQSPSIEIIDLYERIIKRKNRWIIILTTLSLLFASVFIFLLIWDLCNLNIGFIRTR